MYRVWQKMKNLKAPLKKLNAEDFEDVHIAVTKTWQEMVYYQDKMHADPDNTDWAEKEKEAGKEHSKAKARYTDLIPTTKSKMQLDQGGG